MPESISSLLAKASAEKVARAALAILQAYHQYEAERLSEILAGYGDLCIEKLAASWQFCRAGSKDELYALRQLLLISQAELDGENHPLMQEKTVH